MYILDSDRQSYLYNPNVDAVKLADMLSFDDTNEKYDQDLAFAYSGLGLIRIYEPTANNFITSVEQHAVGGGYSLKIRYNYQKQITLVNGDFVVSDEDLINVQQLTMQQISNSINTLPY
ncbi:MAG: hypothetical protein EZS28_032026 [Streblomastix strix]|uniref:Uncharacterized protein n=1 Tax=Streblomastix strix TaxID=222440 RepID=A0A5J4UPX6_9EUKA|nr:MAG: hypothetical protein EZS28_032026 [Streblomastix strix]